MTIKYEQIIFASFVVLVLVVSAISIFATDELGIESSSAGSFGISPPYIYADDLRPGDVYEQSIRIMRSDTSEEKQVTARFDNPEVAKMIKVKPSESMVFEKGQSVLNYKFILEPPEDAYRGEYKSNLYFAIVSTENKKRVGIALGARADVAFSLDEGRDPGERYIKKDIIEIGETKLGERLAGSFIIRSEANGEVYYIHPREASMYYLDDYRDFELLVEQEARGISDFLLERIEPDLASAVGDDIDGDGLADTWETALGTDPELEDTDLDGEFDLAELLDGKSPLQKDRLMNYSSELAQNLGGFLLMQVDNRGQIWYVVPKARKRVFIDDLKKFKDILRPYFIGISEENFHELLKK